LGTPFKDTCQAVALTGFLFSKAENKFEIFVHKVIALQSFRQTILASIKNILARIQDD
jgi:hypothetical protein